jgi:N-acetylglucosaminyldiphosphoundecaprenol N-acetyl-beta-D-mannosaminyltransferase
MIDINLYFSKVPSGIEDLLPKHKKAVTFLSYYSYYLAMDSDVNYDDFDYIAIDGNLVKNLYNFAHKYHRTIRMAMDMTSLAPLIFNYLIETDGSIYFIGSRQNEIEQFIKIIKASFTELQICGYRNGYFDSDLERKNVLEKIVISNPDVIIIGTGTPLQDKMAMELKTLGFKGTSYTCGGFIHQTQKNINYFPKIFDKLNIRLLWRLLNEKNIWKKIYPALFVFLYQYIKYLFSRRI